MVLGLVAQEAVDSPSFTVATSSLIAVLGLVAINGFFVAAEFAMVAARRSKLDEMVARGDRGAKAVMAALPHLDRYIAGTQLGITIASLALGWVGEPVLASIFNQLFRLLIEVIFILVGIFLLWVGVNGRYLFDRRSTSWLIISVALVLWGLQSWWLGRKTVNSRWRLASSWSPLARRSPI